MRSLSAKVLRRIRAFVSPMGFTEPNSEARFIVDAVDFALKPKRSLAPAKKRREAKKKAHREETGAIRAAVVKRADNTCEACRSQFRAFDYFAMDHFFGGSGRRRAMQRPETCWLLCRDCNHLKTFNDPSAAAWIERFITHAERHGYTREAEMASARLDALKLQGRAS